MIWFRKRHIVYALIILIGIWFSAIQSEFSFGGLLQLENTWDFIQRNFWPLRWDLLPYLLQQSLVTLGIAFLGTIAALVIALPISFLAAENTSASKFAYFSIRSILSLVRSINCLWSYFCCVSWTRTICCSHGDFFA